MFKQLKERLRAGFRRAAPAAAAALALAQTSTSTSGYDAVGTVVTMLIAVALPALILVSIVKMIMNHIRA
ncbi:hypothetical protein Pyrde_0092 [Pyrodictium delaneyi]|uniref:Uncharacterized protein n=1 Tax=Pyrodictium delaneyi TaxID=1273541 RepID=A0A0P0N0V7_9CREN|nr:hypothetical protein [Pyrodictium delaneyi]ALL00142.1 hypothetical protein Pyrde_0092 [Pyrodictium delaneyi]